MSVIDALLEGFDAGEGRDFHGRWIKGATSERHGSFKIGDLVTHETGSRGAGGHGPVTFTKQPGVSEVVGFQRNGNLRIREPKHGTTHDVHHTHAQLAPNPMSSSSRERGLADIEAGQRTDRPRVRPEDQHAFNAVTGLGREGTAARERGAPNVNVEHADTRDKLTNLPQGQKYGLHGPGGAVGHVERTAQGWAVTGPGGAVRVHKTPSSAAGHAMKIQRQAAVNHRAWQQTRAANLDRMGVRLGKIGEAAPAVLGALLEGC